MIKKEVEMVLHLPLIDLDSYVYTHPYIDLAVAHGWRFLLWTPACTRGFEW